ncbi:MAG TPA: nuclear transport factor 2 family protein [Chitinophagaceae bacterium]|nr:nuclear transport factor 2 family protein [Chitinophagaceae bacterium]
MKQLLATLTIFSVSSLLFVSCDDKTASSTTEEIKPTFDIAGAKKVIDSLNVVFGSMVSKGDSVGLASLYTSDAKFMVPNMPTASGRSAIQSAFAGLFAAMGTPGLALTTTDIWGSEELITEVGTYTMTDKTGKEIDKGKYIDLWKMEDGKWKLHRDIFNSDMPPSSSK